jgi:hypothetical protein
VEPETLYSGLTPGTDGFQNLCRHAGLGEGVWVERLAAGRNNRIFRLARGERAVVVKIYFVHPGDPRDRLKQEFGFLEYLWSRGVRNVPRPIWADYQCHLGVYEFVSGKRPALEEIGLSHVAQAINFYRRINIDRLAPKAQALPCASEACFSIAEHLACVERRIERLDEIKAGSDLDQAARYFVRGELRPLWTEIREKGFSELCRENDREKQLDREARCLSPSDFGFHNTLMDESGTFHFLDFEYAGWDDPAKLVCDFANQPDMLLSENMSRQFESAVIADDPAPEYLARRILQLMPVYQIKWSCIILKDFLPQGHERAVFLGESKDREAYKAEQLKKARSMLERAEQFFKKTRWSL